MDEDDVIRRNTEALERLEERYDRYDATLDRNDEAFERMMERFDRNEAFMQRMRLESEAFRKQMRLDAEDQRAFMRETLLRVERLGRDQVRAIHQLSDDMRAEFKDVREALLAILDRLEPGPGGNPA